MKNMTKDMAEPIYSLRHTKAGDVNVKQKDSPLLVFEGVPLELVPAEYRAQCRIIRWAIEIARENHYDMDIFHEYTVIELAVYKKLTGRNGLTPLIPLLSEADKVDVFNHRPGESVMLTAVYLSKAA